ncbi:MAG: alpha/beta fold hydrolase [Betaproteobacteria bacterium]|nr:alpha/beta fold hydrolase [Betaproteobacteria bacterium]
MTLHSVDRVAVEDTGEGEAIVCVHGLGGSANVWTPLAPGLSRYRVVRVELPGSARSARAEGEISIERFVGCLEQICERLAITRAHWLAHSLGTIVTQHFAVLHPKRVASLTLIGPLSEPASGARPPLLARAALARSQGVAGLQTIADQTVAAALSSETRARQPLVAAFVRDSVARSCPEGYARTCEALAQARSAPLDRISAPVLLLTGEEDAVAPPQSVRALADRLISSPDVRMRVFPRCGHWQPLERPAECLREIGDFIATANRRPERPYLTALATGAA